MCIYFWEEKQEQGFEAFKLHNQKAKMHSNDKKPNWLCTTQPISTLQILWTSFNKIFNMKSESEKRIHGKSKVLSHMEKNMLEVKQARQLDLFSAIQWEVYFWLFGLLFLIKMYNIQS